MTKRDQTKSTSTVQSSHLADTGPYSFDSQMGIWQRAGAQHFAYSDGDEIESRILDVVRVANDVSVFSPDLRAAQTDWASTYHLSATRANLLRPLEKAFNGSSVLEIGAGCGAISRYLVESGAKLTALEGSPRRATIAAARCRDMGDAKFIADTFDDFESDELFDIVTLIGVLEYSRLFTPGEDAVGRTLEKAKRHLKPDGILLIAIENQLGLKYFAGMPEDHYGSAMDGIEDHYYSTSPVTFGHQELAGRIKTAGFSDAQFALPFPDYKLPKSIILPAGQNLSSFNASSLAAQSAGADRQLVRPTTFSMSQAFGVVGRNDLLKDLSNSFLILARNSANSPSFESVTPNVIATHYATERQKGLNVAASFVKSDNGIKVERRSIDGASALSDSDLIRHTIKDEEYINGTHWGLQLDRILSCRGWTVEQVADWAQIWIDALESNDLLPHPKLQLSLDSEVSGALFDALPRNLITTKEGSFFIDQEWSVQQSFTWGFLLYRGIVDALVSSTRIAQPAPASLSHVPTLLRAVYRRLGLIITTREIEEYLDREASFQDEILGLVRSVPHENVMQDFVLRISPNMDHLMGAADEYLGDKARFEIQLAESTSKIEELTQQLSAARAQISDLELHSGTLEDANHRLSADFSAIRSNLEDEITRKNNDILNLQSDMGRSESASGIVEALKSRLAAVELKEQDDQRRLTALSIELSQSGSALCKSMQETDSLRIRLEATEQARLRIESIVDQLKRDNDSLRALRDELTRSAQTREDLLRDTFESKLKALELEAGLLQERAAQSHAAALNKLEDEVKNEQQRSDVLSGLLDKVNQSSAEAKQTLQDELQDQMRERHELEERIMDSNKRIEDLEALIIALQRQIEDYTAHRASDRHTIAEKDQEIHRIWGIVDNLSTELEGARENSTQQSEIILRQEEIVSSLSDRSMELDRILSSTSWKLAAPIRLSGSAIIGAKSTTWRAMKATALGTYRLLPNGWRESIKDRAFRSSPSLFARTAAYQQWLEQVSPLFNPDAASTIPSPASTDTPTTLTNVLWNADGIREWEDYDSVRNSIDAELSKQRSDFEPTPRPMIEFATGKELEFAKSIAIPTIPNSPTVTILIPVFNHIRTTLECIASIADSVGDKTPSFEILVADDASTDRTAEILNSVANIRVFTQENNLGFLLNCNTSSKKARGKYLVFLNNDVQVTPNWLEALVSTIESDPKIGAVGPKVIYPSGWLQEAGIAWRRDGTSEMIGLNSNPNAPQYNYTRDVDYCSGACLLLRRTDFEDLGGFDDRFAPAYCEDSDICMQLRASGKRIVYCADAEVVHHLSQTSNAMPSEYKLSCIATNLDKLSKKWRDRLDASDKVRTIAFYLPQFHPIAENDLWWGKGFTEWTNVTKAKPNFLGHYQPRVPAELGYYDLRLTEVMEMQAELARRYGIGGWCFYYYWFAGHRLLERPIEQMLETGKPDFPFCLCWANENWTRRWDGQEQDVLLGQKHSPEDDEAVIRDLIRYFKSPNYIRVDGKPFLLVYRVTLFPNFAETADRWRRICREEGIGEIYLAQVESFELVTAGIKPEDMGCDAAVEFPPQGMARTYELTSPILNPEFEGNVADYREIAVTYATRPQPDYRRFMGVMPGWDNTARRQNNSYAFEHATPGAFQAWLETAMQRTKSQYAGDERIVFINAWNEWAEGAYLEPDRRFGHSFLQAHLNAMEASKLVRHGQYSLG